MESPSSALDHFSCSTLPFGFLLKAGVGRLPWGSPLITQARPSSITPDHKCTPCRTVAGRGLTNELVQAPHLIDKKTEFLRDEEAYLTLHDKSVAKPGPEPSNIRLFPKH